MCYLARTNGSEKSLIEWYFEIRNPLKDIDIKLDYKCFENGEIRLFVDLIKEDSSSETIELADKKTGLNDVVKCSFSNGRFVLDLSGPIPKLAGIKLRAEMSKGRGENAWQHTQLFRQALNDSTNYLFDVVFNFL
jgi:peptide-N4-(N-acetyl-beta-glucosaminyl)asparagine amidase